MKAKVRANVFEKTRANAVFLGISGFGVGFGASIHQEGEPPPPWLRDMGCQGGRS